VRTPAVLILCALIAACSQQPTRTSAPPRYENTMPVDFSGSWERNYWRGDDINRALNQWFRRLSNGSASQQVSGAFGLDNAGTINSDRDVAAVLALARLADVITRLRYFSISQSEDEIRVERENDFDIACQFDDGAAQGARTSYGAEICGWNGEQFVSRLILPDGLLVSHRFTIAPDNDNLHISTTVSSTTSGLSFTLGRFYTKYQPSPSRFDCVDTLSRNRVCTMGEGSP
jgi:hypothetical protein